MGAEHLSQIACVVLADLPCDSACFLHRLQDNALKEYPPNIVLIEPLANMTAIEDFLWQRVNRGSTLEALRARAAAEVSAAASKPAEGAAAAGAALAAATAAAGGSAPAAAAAPAPVNGATTTRRRSSSGGGAKESAAPAAAAAHGQQLPAAASKAQPIPDADASGGRMTRAQAARARAEAQARAEEAANQRRARRAAARSAAAVGSDGMLDERDGSEEDLLMRDHTSSDHEDEQMHDDGDDMDEDHDMDGAGGFIECSMCLCAVAASTGRMPSSVPAACPGCNSSSQYCITPVILLFHPLNCHSRSARAYIG